MRACRTPAAVARALGAQATGSAPRGRRGAGQIDVRDRAGVACGGGAGRRDERRASGGAAGRRLGGAGARRGRQRRHRHPGGDRRAAAVARRRGRRTAGHRRLHAEPPARTGATASPTPARPPAPRPAAVSTPAAPARSHRGAGTAWARLNAATFVRAVQPAFFAPRLAATRLGVTYYERTHDQGRGRRHRPPSLRRRPIASTCSDTGLGGRRRGHSRPGCCRSCTTAREIGGWRSPWRAILACGRLRWCSRRAGRAGLTLVVGR